MSDGHVRDCEEWRCLLAVHIHSWHELQLGNSVGGSGQCLESYMDVGSDQCLRPTSVGSDISLNGQHDGLLRSSHDRQPEVWLADGYTRRIRTMVLRLEFQKPRS